MSTKLIVSKSGVGVLVTHHIKQTPQNIPILEVVAVCGMVQERRLILIGADDGPRRYLSKEETIEELLALLDKKRQLVADEAAWKEGLRIAVKEIS